MASPALISFLGFPGWPALHLQLPSASDPPGLAGRLLQAQRAADPQGGAVALLACFLKQQRDAQPLARPWGALPAGGHRLSHRYRIVCRRQRQPPQVMAWCWLGTGAGWRACGKPESLPLYLKRFAAAPPGGDADAACAGRVAVRDPACGSVGLDLRLSLVFRPLEPRHEG